jgi:xanthine dehydrogenase YagT iron-sulfur-binding subunit
MMPPEFTRRQILEASAMASAAATFAGPVAEAADASAVRHQVTLTVNGERRTVQVENRVSLLDWLREQAGLFGAKKGCNEGACGACTVLIDGQPMNACLTFLVQCAGREVTTIEGLAGKDGQLHPVQQAFIDNDAFQCGYCTPGQVISAVACIQEGHATDEVTVREWMSGNLCRCSAYPQIIAAVLDAAQRMRRK